MTDISASKLALKVVSTYSWTDFFLFPCPQKIFCRVLHGVAAWPLAILRAHRRHPNYVTDNTRWIKILYSSVRSRLPGTRGLSATKGLVQVRRAQLTKRALLEWTVEKGRTLPIASLLLVILYDTMARTTHSGHVSIIRLQWRRW